jgi:hypothetical protein
VVSFIQFPLIAFVGFAGMVAATAVFVKNVRRIGNAGLKEVSEQLAAKDVNGAVDGIRIRFFDRFRKN